MVVDMGTRIMAGGDTYPPSPLDFRIIIILLKFYLYLRKSSPEKKFFKESNVREIICCYIYSALKKKIGAVKYLALFFFSNIFKK